MAQTIETQERIRAMLERRLDDWLAKIDRLHGGAKLGYQEKKDAYTLALLNKPGIHRWNEFTCLNSLREVEPSVGLILDDHGLDEPVRSR